MNPVNSNTRVIVGMSGGVDSSVTALLLKQQGYQVSGLFMKNWDEDDGSEYCTAMQDLHDAQAVCDKLGITLHTANFAAEYWDNVFEYFLEEYKAGRTPNPDVLCNREIKFKVFLDYAKTLGADLIATGHYARIKHDNGHSHLLKGLDPLKDQSYFLHQVSETEFKQTLFPIGELEKTEVRKIADEHDLHTKHKKDSTGICFIGERRFSDFLETYLPAQPGHIVDDAGNVLAKHNGLMFHTIGQRKGLGIGGLKNSGEDPWYVAEKDLIENQLIVVQGVNHPKLFKQSLFIRHLHWISEEKDLSQQSLDCHCKTRYRQDDQACSLRKTDQGFEVTFSEMQRAITPGQYAVFYEKDICLGGGVIEYAS